MRLNKKAVSEPVFTGEGGKADRINNYLALKRSVLATLLFERNFYEAGEDVYARIKNLVPKVAPEKVADLAIQARNQYKLRHVPLAIAREMARHDSHKHLVSDVLNEIIQRPDELGEFTAIYNKDGKQPLSSQVKRGLGRALKKFNEYSLSKYNQDGEYRLRDILFLTHPKPENKAQANLWKRLANNELKTPDTWEVSISATNGIGKKEAWTRLLKEDKLFILALLKNLRNLQEAGVDDNLIRESLLKANPERALPFRFISAAKYAPVFEPELEALMFKSLENSDKLSGSTALVLDVSGSMDMHRISAKSDLTRLEAAISLGILAREVCEKVDVFTFSNDVVKVAPRRGFALKDVIINSQPHKSTKIAPVINLLNTKDYDRVIVLTDGQIEDTLPKSNAQFNYMLNVASEKNGIGYGNGWKNIDGWSEAVINYILISENEEE